MLYESTLVFLCNLESHIASAKGDVRERPWLMQRISLAIVRGNAISIAMLVVVDLTASSLSPIVMIFLSMCNYYYF